MNEIKKEVPWSIKDVFVVLAISFLLAIMMSFILIGPFRLELETVTLILIRFYTPLSLLLLPFFWAIKLRGASIRDIGIQGVSHPLKNLFIGIGVGIIAFFISFGWRIFPQLFILLESHLPEDFARGFIKEGLKWLFTKGLIVVFLDAFYQEVYFRGFAYQAFLKKFNRKWALILSALFFSIMHFDYFNQFFWQYFLIRFAAGLLFAYLFDITHSLLAPTVAHSLCLYLSYLLEALVIMNQYPTRFGITP